MQELQEFTRIAITRQDGGVSIMSFVTLGRGTVLPDGAEWAREGLWFRQPSDQNIQNEVARAVPDATGWHRITEADIPADRTFRDALVHVDGTLKHDVQRAKAVVLRNVRHLRAHKLDELDREFNRAVGVNVMTGDGSAAREVETRRQALRDLPATLALDQHTTIEGLRAAHDAAMSLLK
jgi:hypothetical protein